MLVGVGEVEMRRLDDVRRFFGVDHDRQGEEDFRQRATLDSLFTLLLIDLGSKLKKIFLHLLFKMV